MKGCAFLLLLSPFVFADIFDSKSSVTSHVSNRASNSHKQGELHPGNSFPDAGPKSYWQKVVENFKEEVIRQYVQDQPKVMKKMKLMGGLGLP